MADVQESSWAEHIRAIKHEKVTLPWDRAAVVPTERVTTFDKTRQERQFDPLLQRFRDPRVETTRRQAEKSYRNDVLNRSHVREVKYGQGYNILCPTKVAKPTWNETQRAVAALPTQTQARLREIEHAKRMRASRVDYNILSNMSTTEHHWAPKEQRPAPLPPPRHGSGPGKPSVESSATIKRDYNIVSGKYVNHHSKRVAIDRAKNSERAAERFWQTHDFNPVAGEFYDREKEDLFKEARGVFEQSHGDVQRQRLPPKVRDSEGYLYNIVSMRAKDEDGLRTLDMRERGAGSGKITKAAVEADIAKRQNDRYDLVEQRKMNRVAAKRFDEMTKHGYDLVTGQPFWGRNAKVVPRPVHMSRPPSVWAKASRRRVGGEGHGGEQHRGDIGRSARSSARRGAGELRGSASSTNVASASAAAPPTGAAAPTPVLRPAQQGGGGFGGGGDTMSSTFGGGGGGGGGGESQRSERRSRSATPLGSAARQMMADAGGGGAPVPKLDLSKTGGGGGKVRTGGF